MGEQVLADDTYSVGEDGEVARRIDLRDPGIDDARRPLLLATGLAGLGFAPFALADGQAAWFGLLGGQIGRATLMHRLSNLPTATLTNHLRSFPSAALTELASYWPAMLALLIVIGLLAQPSARVAFGRHRAIALLFCVAGSVTMFLVDLLPYPFTARYPVPQLPLVAIAGAVALASLLRQHEHHLTAVLTATVALTLVLMNPFAASREAVGAPNFVETYRANPPTSQTAGHSSFRP